MKSFKQLRESELAKQVLASAKKVSPTANIDTRSPAERKADTDKMLAARAAAKPKVTNQPSKPSTPEQQMKNQNASMAASYAKHKPGQYVGDSVELEGDSINEDHYERAEDSKTLANTAKNEGDEIGFNSHMADHHDHLSQWHEEKGRASAAQSHADKSEMYANKMTQVAKGVMEASSAGARMQKALQKAKEDRERSERNAERLLNPVKKPVQPEPVKETVVAEAAQGHTIEAHGIRGMKATPWRKTFKSHEHLEKWADANDSVEVHGTRDLEKAKKTVDEESKTQKWIVHHEGQRGEGGKMTISAKTFHDAWRKANEHDLDIVKIKPANKQDKKVAEEFTLDEGSFKYHMDKAIAAHEKGDDKKKAYHLENARTAKFAMKTADYAKNRELLDKHKQMSEEVVSEEKPGLYANIHAKRKRIAAGSGERMRKPGSKGAPTAKAFKQAQKTVKENIDDGVNEGIARLISKSIKNVTATKKTPQEKADIRLNNLNK